MQNDLRMIEDVVTQCDAQRHWKYALSNVLCNDRAKSMAQAHGTDDDAHPRVVAEDVSMRRVRRRVCDPLSVRQRSRMLCRVRRVHYGPAMPHLSRTPTLERRPNSNDAPYYHTRTALLLCVQSLRKHAPMRTPPRMVPVAHVHVPRVVVSEIYTCVGARNARVPTQQRDACGSI